MYKWLFVFVALLLQGCVSKSQNEDSFYHENKERMFIYAKNPPQLVEYYRTELSKSESADVRIKLAQAYLDNGDSESSIFTLSRLASGDRNFKAEMLLAKSFFYQEDFDMAKLHLTKAMSFQGCHGEAHNLLGVISVSLGDFTFAEKSFVAARGCFYKDSVIKNNLATIYLMNEQYSKSHRLLLSAYKDNPEDKTAKANLIIVLIKLGHLEEARELFALDYDIKDMAEVISVVSSYDFVGQD